MAKPIPKQGLDFSFAKGLDTKTDRKRVQFGNFLKLRNTVFDKEGELSKRNGYKRLSTLPDTASTYLTTFNSNLTAIGTSVQAYNSASSSWVSKGSIQPLTLDTFPLIRNNLNQTACDAVIAPNGLVCTVYLESDGTAVTNKYAVANSVTGQNIVAPTAIPVSSGTVSGGMRVFFLGNNFIIVFTNSITAVDHLQYIAVNATDPTVVTANTDIAADYDPATTIAWDGVVYSDRLYLAWNTSSGGQAVKVAFLSNVLILSALSSFTGSIATMMSLTVDETQAQIKVYVSFYDSMSEDGYTGVVDINAFILMNPVLILGSKTVLNIASAAMDGTCRIYYEVENEYDFASGVFSNFIETTSVTPLLTTFRSIFASAAAAITVSSPTGLVNGMYLIDNTTPGNIDPGTDFTIAGSVLTLSAPAAGNSAASPGDLLTAATLSDPVIIVRSVGLASKAFIVNGVVYLLSAFDSPYQPSYFLINATESTEDMPVISAKLAYENGGGYLTLGLPFVTVNDNYVQIPYLFKDLIAAVNKNTDVPTGTQTAGVYSQTGINIVNITIGTSVIDTAEVGNDLHISGGFLWMYDGQLPVENNFFVWPDTDITDSESNAEWSETGGSIVAQPDGATNTDAYFYQYTYEWTDNQGNAFRSAPSIPVPVTTTGNGTAGSITNNIPTLRLTYKIASPVKIVVYRWSVAQPVYYQVTSITSPLLNDTTADSVEFEDTFADATILGNNILYTNGGVVPNTSPPATDVLTLFDNRLWLIDSEDRNTLWYSKQIIKAVPVEMSDEFTKYITPTTASNGSTGPLQCLFPMDDKQILFKRQAAYYINGQGPDNTGQNNQYSDPIFITSTVGCSNQQSIVLIPKGLMFQSDKGIWLLDRNLETSYIGAPVEEFNDGRVQSAQNIPGTNQIRFILDTGVTLMYDYYYEQWGTFIGVPAISSCIFEDLHTFINDVGRVYQENPGSYIDGSSPVLINFRTGPLRLGDLQNFQRSYFYYFLGQYISPHKLYVTNFWDYSESPEDGRIIDPTNYSSAYGDIGPYGEGNPYGGPGVSENWRVFANRRCMALSIEVQEIYDPTLGVPAGAGLTLSGINIVLGMKSPFKTISSSNSIG